MALTEKEIHDYNASREAKALGRVCHAPFYSLNFEQGGNATACCYNREFVLGSYPENSLEEIWFGKKAESFRAYIDRNDLSHGCSTCELQIKSKNYKGAGAQGFDEYAEPNKKNKGLLSKFLNGQKPGMPKLMEFEIDNTCNLECVMCSGKYSSLIRKNREKLPPVKNPYNDGFVEQLMPFIPHLQQAKFLGGEPFITPIYYKMWEIIEQLNPSLEIYVTTNGTILTSKVKEVLDKLNMHIVVSLDGITKETYEAIRLNGNFDKVLKNIEYFSSFMNRRNKTLSFAICPMPQNWQEIPEMLRFASMHKAKIYFNSVFYPYEYSLRSMHENELEEVINTYAGAEPASGSFLDRFNYNALQDFTKLVKRMYADRIEAIRALELLTKEMKEIEKLPEFYFSLFLPFQEKCFKGVNEAASFKSYKETGLKKIEQAIHNESFERSFHYFKQILVNFGGAVIDEFDEAAAYKKMAEFEQHIDQLPKKEKVLAGILFSDFNEVANGLHHIKPHEVPAVFESEVRPAYEPAG